MSQLINSLVDINLKIGNALRYLENTTEKWNEEEAYDHAVKIAASAAILHSYTLGRLVVARPSTGQMSIDDAEGQGRR